MKNVALSALFCCFLGALQAQTYGAKNQFEFEQFTGFQRVIWNNAYPTAHRDNTVEQSLTLGFNYLRALSPNFQFKFGVAMGAQTFTQKTRVTDIINEFDNPMFRSKEWNVIAQLQFGLKYTQKINDKVNFAIGVNYGQHVGNDIRWAFVYNADNMSGYGEGTGDAVSVGFIQIMPEYQFVLKNKDLLSVKVGMQLFNESHIRGTFTSAPYIPNSTAVNNYHNKRGQFQFGIGYTLSRVRKLDKLSALNSEGIGNFAARKKIREERREHSDQAKFVGVQVGAGIIRANFSDPNNVFRNSPYASFSFRVNYEHGIKNGFFAEAGYHMVEYYSSFAFDQIVNASASSNLYFTHQLSLGGGYRVKIKNIPILNVHGGFTAGTIGDTYFHDFGNTFNQGGQSFIYSMASERKSSVFASAYLGVSKDIALNNRFALTLNYRFHQGLNTISETRFNYSGTAFEGQQQAVAKQKGSECSWMVGLKFKIAD